jgi:hypothetical protein
MWLKYNVMKKILIICILILTAIISAPAQQLQNTYWTVYNPSGSFFQYFYFGFDTLFFSYNNVSYTHRSIFVENGNLLTLNDPAAWPGQCVENDTGKYSFFIQNDTLDFTLISDPCSGGRDIVMGTYIFVRLYPTGIEDVSSDAVQLYPNPSPNGIFNLRFNSADKIMVCDAQGRKVFEANISFGERNHSLNLQQLLPGIYFLTLQNDSDKEVFKIMR